MDASDRITAYIERLGDWRGTRLLRIRQVIGAAWGWNHVIVPSHWGLGS